MANWNWDDGTPEDGPRPYSGPTDSPKLTDPDTLLFCADLIKKHDELAKMMGFPTEVVWLEVPDEVKELVGAEDEQATRIYAWDGFENYHEIVCERTEATKDFCRIRFVRNSDEIEINVTWAQDA